MIENEHHHTLVSNQENINCSNKKKISTPSLLFFKSQNKSQSKIMSRDNHTYRSPSPNISNSQVKISHNNVSISHHRNQSQNVIPQITCNNHRNKNAEYVRNDQDVHNFGYCEKCAILMASQGLSVSKINQKAQLDSKNCQKYSCRGLFKQIQSSQSLDNSSVSNIDQSVEENTSERPQQVQGFLSKMRLMSGNLKLKQEQIQDCLITSEEFYGTQIEQIDEYFSLVYQSLQLEKNKCYNYILQQRKKMQQCIRQQKQQIKQWNIQINKIIEDIEDNLETVFDIQEKVYQLVIGQYTDQYQDYNRTIGQLNIEPIQLRKIDFAGVPQCIYSLSDVVIQSSQNSKQGQFTQNYFRSKDCSSSQCPQQSKIKQTQHYTTTISANTLAFSFQVSQKEEQSIKKDNQLQQNFHSYIKTWQ